VNRAVLLFLVAGVIAIAGCPAPPPPPVVGYGLEPNITADRTTVYTGQPLRLILEIENQGDANADKGRVYLFGPIDTKPTKTAWGKTGKNPPDKFTNILPATDERPAGKKRYTWTLKPPLLERGQTKTDEFTGRVYYNYRTKVPGTIPIYSEAEAEAELEAGRALDKSSFTYPRTPFDIKISVAPDPPVLDAEKTFTITITVTNVGGGTPYNWYKTDNYTIIPPPFEVTDLNKFEFKIVGPTPTEIEDLDCVDWYDDPGEWKRWYDMIAGTTDIYCTVKYNKTVETKVSMPLSIEAHYGYYKDAKISLTAIGR
jgi:hypothetical protein